MPQNFKLVKSTDQSTLAETLHIKSSKGVTSIRSHINIVRYQDKDSGQWVFYAPSFELSGYGENQDKALQMIKEAFGDFLDYMSKLSAAKMQAELTKLGWKKNKLWNKDYSRAYVNGEGELQNFNADKVERFTLVA